nr:A24 family peptidase C-terminal domain-containing protein [Methanosphaera sp. WGK6]
MNKLFKENKYVIILFTIIVLIWECIEGNFLIFLSQFIIIEFIVIIRNIMKIRLFNKVFTDFYDVSCLNNGMILAYPLCRYDNQYYFNELSWFNKLKNNSLCEVIIYANAAGLEDNDILLLKKLNERNFISNVPIKKGLPFAPFILVGLIITLLFGNIFQVFLFIMELI